MGTSTRMSPSSSVSARPGGTPRRPRRRGARRGRSRRRRCDRSARRRAGSRHHGSRGPSSPPPSRAEVGVRRDRREPVVRGLGEGLLRRVEEVGVAPLATRPTRPRSWCSCERPNVSARSRISVFAFGMSRPLSTIVVETRTSELLLPEVDDHCSSACSFICPCASAPAPPAPARGSSSRPGRSTRPVVHEEHLPSRSSSRRIAAATCLSS